MEGKQLKYDFRKEIYGCKTRIMIFPGYVAYVWTVRIAKCIYLERLKEGNQSEDLGVDGRTMGS